MGLLDDQGVREDIALLREIRDLLKAQAKRAGDGPTLGQLAMANCSHGEYDYTQNGTRVCRKCGR